MNDFFKNLRFVFMPHYWLMNERYSPNWDSKLNKLLDCFEFTDIEEFRAKLGEEVIWIANHPYASFTPYNSSMNFRASRLTIYRAEQKLNRIRVKVDLYND